MKAIATHYQQAPRKVRLLADLVRGKKVVEALSILSFTDKRASDPVAKVIASAAANAEVNFNVPKADLMVKEIRIDKGRVLKRSRARARGSAFPIRHRSSHISVLLGRIGETLGVTDKKVSDTKAIS